jgi:hypothetical protein
VTRAWFALLVLTQLLFLAILPAGLGNDESGHLVRMWALTEGGFHCDKMPQAVAAFQTKSLIAFHRRGQSFAAYWRDGLAMAGGGQRVDGHNYECSYFPLALAVPSLLTRLVALDWHGQPRTGGVFVASYVARLCNLVMVDVALWFFLQLVPWAAFLALGFFTLPMAIEQSVSVGHDGALMALALIILMTALTRDDSRGAVVIVLAATAMTLVKPVFFGFSLLAWPLLVKERRPFLASAALPWTAWKLWYWLGEVERRQWHPRFADPVKQAALLHQPLHALGVLVGYGHYLIDDGKLSDFPPHRINGVWNTFFFANLWIDLPRYAYLLAAAGLTLAAVAAALSPRPVRTATPWWATTAALLGVAAAIPATIFALYLIFTPVGAPGPYGVQGRYHAVPFLVLSMFGVRACSRRWARAPLMAAAAAALLFAADGFALATTWHYYWI